MVYSKKGDEDLINENPLYLVIDISKDSMKNIKNVPVKIFEF